MDHGAVTRLLPYSRRRGTMGIMFRRTLLALTLAVLGSTASAQPPNATPIAVFKSPTCGCCGKWVEHLRKAGFAPTVTDTTDVSAVKLASGVPSNLASCHTAKVGGYVIEGHVPADAIRTLLRRKPAIAGLAVPGMPMGSPGMEGGYADKYDIIAFRKDGGTSVFESR